MQQSVVTGQRTVHELYRADSDLLLLLLHRDTVAALQMDMRRLV